MNQTYPNIFYLVNLIHLNWCKWKKLEVYLAFLLRWYSFLFIYHVIKKSKLAKSHLSLLVIQGICIYSENFPHFDIFKLFVLFILTGLLIFHGLKFSICKNISHLKGTLPNHFLNRLQRQNKTCWFLTCIVPHVYLILESPMRVK